MDKLEIAKAFGNQSELARSLGVTRATISNWPRTLNQKQADLVTGAALRLGIELPVVPGKCTNSPPPSSNDGAAPG